MFVPEAMPSGSAPVESAASARAPLITSSEAVEVVKAPPTFAFESRMYVATASITYCGACDPPGPSR